MRTIIGYDEEKKRLVDQDGYFAREIALKRLEKYSNEIDMVLTKYNKKSCDETMMVKGLRKSSPETTNRKIHQEDLEKIVKQIAKKIGLNEQIVGIMGKHHDIGHTFLGHSGEWWISNIQEDMGIGYFCHNTLGARELIYTNQIYDEIIEKIIVFNPDIKPEMLEKIKKYLWLIIDGINAHNGEKPDKEYIADIKKQQEDFEDEMLSCYTIKGFDRKITPATPEACLMRLADQISYIPLDMVDGLREGMIRDDQGNIVSTLDDDYKSVLTKLGITEKEIEEANANKEFGIIAERIKEILVNDVIKNSTRQKIKMSEEIMNLMNKLRSLNNAKIVDNVILIEDQQTYPAAIRMLMNRYSNIILQNGLLEKLPNANKDTQINKELASYERTPDEGFIKYICNTNQRDFEFTTKIVEEATRQSISDELDIARQAVQKGEQYKDKEECGLSYASKNARIKDYIIYYRYMLEAGKLVGYTEETKQQEIEQIMGHIESGKQMHNYLNMEQRMAMAIAAKYISSLNDHEFIQLLQDNGFITEKQYKSLTRKYKDIDIRKESQMQSNWVSIEKSHEKAARAEISK